MGKIAAMEYFRVPPRWLFVKITDELGVAGWGEASLEGHTEAVEACLDSWFERYKGLEAEYVIVLTASIQYLVYHAYSKHRYRDIERIWQLSWRGSFYRGGPVFMSAMSGIDIALWDLKGM